MEQVLIPNQSRRRSLKDKNLKRNQSRLKELKENQLRLVLQRARARTRKKKPIRKRNDLNTIEF